MGNVKPIKTPAEIVETYKAWARFCVTHGKIEDHCRHVWEVIHAKFQKPLHFRDFKINGMWELSQIESLIYGRTTIIQRCSLCGWVEQTSEPGDATGAFANQYVLT